MRFSHAKLRRAIAAALILGCTAAAQPGGTAPPSIARPASETSPFLGEWELDLTRMPENYGPPPKRVTFTFEALDTGEWVTTVRITAPDDSVRQMIGRFRRDGRAVASQGDNSEGDHAAFMSPAPNVLVMNTARNGGPASVRVYVISADGKEMTESAANVDEQGAPFIRNFHFRRIR